mgnify:CR=1 FL=1
MAAGARIVEMDVTDSAGQQSLNTQVGQLRRPAPPIRTRSGVFLLVLAGPATGPLPPEIAISALGPLLCRRLGVTL